MLAQTQAATRAWSGGIDYQLCLTFDVELLWLGFRDTGNSGQLTFSVLTPGGSTLTMKRYCECSRLPSFICSG